MSARIYLTIAEVLAIHHQQIEEYGGVQGIRDRGLLEAAVFRPQMAYYAGAVEEATALMESLGINRPFFDGNKRVAFAAAHTFLLANGFDLEVSPAEAFEFVMGSLRASESKFLRILNWIEDHLVAL